MTRPSSAPPGSLGLPFIGEAFAFLKDPFSFTLARTKQHGSVWKTRILSDKVVFFAGPEAFAFFMDRANFTRENGSPKFLQALLHPDAVPFLDGDKHATRKRLMLRAFSDEAMDSYLPGMFAVIGRFVDRWAAAGETRIAADLPQLGFDLADVLFAAGDPGSSNQQGASDFNIMNRGTFSPPINLPFTAYGKAIKARDRMRAYLKQAVATRGGAGTALGVLKAAQMPSDELEIELLHFYFAAHGGITAALAWLVVVLGEHPELAAKLRAEADAQLGDGTPSLAEVRRLTQARSVSREVLRAFPHIPITFFGIAKRDLEYRGFSIPAGCKGAGAIWATLQDGATFRDPTQFDGDRLGDGTFGALHTHAFVPQGGGPADGHRCAGEALTQLVMPAFLGWFTRHFDLAWPAQDSAPGPGGVGPLPRGGMRVTITRRARA
jgi:cytochrome P450